jgi:hypothetical protein
MHHRPGVKLHRGADGSPTLTTSATLPADEQLRAMA